MDTPRPDPGRTPDPPPDADRRVTPPADLDVVPVDLRDYVDFARGEARRVRVFATPTTALDLWCVEPRQSTGVLAYPEADTTYTVLGGRSWFVTEEGEVGLDPMGALLVRRGVHHGIDNRGTDPLIVLATMSPPDELATDGPVEDGYAALRIDEGRGGVTRALGRILGGRRPPA
ncbi:MAG: hypothetical protein KY457_14035 [Actinobacteria bacterium]|nr:hypothetical protein [Actinomycetota bacterium]